MWSSARGKAIYICLLAKARTLLIQRMCVWRVRYVSKSGLCETEPKWRETIAWNCFKWLSKLKCFNGIPQSCKKCNQDIPRCSMVRQERSALPKTIIHTGWHRSSEILELHDLVPVPSETLPDVSLPQLPAPLRSLRRWDDPLHPGPTARRPRLLTKPDPGNTRKMYRGKQIGELEDTWRHMKMHIKWIDAEQNWDPRWPQLTSHVPNIFRYFSASYETFSCDEPDPFCGDCLLKSEAATRRLIKASGGVKLSSIC